MAFNRQGRGGGGEMRGKSDEIGGCWAEMRELEQSRAPIFDRNRGFVSRLLGVFRCPQISPSHCTVFGWHNRNPPGIVSSSCWTLTYSI